MPPNTEGIVALVQERLSIFEFLKYQAAVEHADNFASEETVDHTTIDRYKKPHFSNPAALPYQFITVIVCPLQVQHTPLFKPPYQPMRTPITPFWAADAPRDLDAHICIHRFNPWS